MFHADVLLTGEIKQSLNSNCKVLFFLTLMTRRRNVGSLRHHFCLVAPLGGSLITIPFKIVTRMKITVVSKLITDRHFSRRNEFQLQIQNRTARRINCNYRNRSVGMSAENLSSQIQIRFSLEFELIAITDTDFEPRMKYFCNDFGCNGNFFQII